MNWTSLSQFLEMGGYGLYVWGAFGLTAITVAIEVLSVWAHGRAVRRGVRA